VSEKLSLPLIIFVIEAMSIVILSTLGLMATTLVTISTVALVAFTWSRLGGTRLRRGRDSALHL
jgi:hypothetical protein